MTLFLDPLFTFQLSMHSATDKHVTSGACTQSQCATKSVELCLSFSIPCSQYHCVHGQQTTGETISVSLAVLVMTHLCAFLTQPYKHEPQSNSTISLLEMGQLRSPLFFCFCLICFLHFLNLGSAPCPFHMGHTLTNG